MEDHLAMKVLSFLVRNHILPYHKVLTFFSVYTKVKWRVTALPVVTVVGLWLPPAHLLHKNPLEIHFNTQVEMLSSMWQRLYARGILMLK